MNRFIPYCGAAPTPSTLHWNHAPVLTALLLTAAAIFLICERRSRRQSVLFAAGWAMLGLCFLSPLCNLGVALFSARSGEHVLLVLIAAPLMAAGFPAAKQAGAFRVLSAATIFASLVWAWHSPRLYDLTLQNNVAFWAMNASMIGAAVWFWRCAGSADGLAALAGVGFVGLQMSLLGALITFANAPFYAVHALTTSAWGLSQIDDQRLGGLILWVPGGLLGVGLSVAALFKWFVELERGRPAFGPEP